MAAGKNGVINGGMDIWQRGTSTTAGGANYRADRWYSGRGGAVAGGTWTRQSSGLDGFQYCLRVARDSGNTSTATFYLSSTLETANSLQFANKTVTMSFYARAGANFSPTSGNINVYLKTGTGTDQNVSETWTGNTNVVSSTATLTTTWQRFTYTGSIGSTATEIGVNFEWTPVGTAGANDYLEITGVQLELGSVATNFSRAGGTIQGELAACRYYYERILPNGSGTGYSGIGHYYDTTNCYTIQNWQQKRVIPTVTFSGATHFTANGSGVNRQSTAVNLDVATTWGCDYRITTSSVTLGSTAVMGIQSTSGYIEASAEL
jgi:hypothetical protein